MRVTAAQRNAELVVELVIDLTEESVVLGREIVRPVHLQQAFGEGHVVVQVARFLEVVGTEHVVELLVHGIAKQLELLAELPLIGGKAGVEEVERRAIEIGADVPVQLAVAGDRLQRDIVTEVVLQRERTAIGLQLRVVVAIGIALVDVAGHEAVVIGKAIVLRIRIGVHTVDGGVVKDRAEAADPADIGKRRRAAAAIGADGNRLGNRAVVGAGKDRRRGLDQRVGNLALVDVGVVSRERCGQRAAIVPLQLAAQVPVVITAFSAEADVVVSGGLVVLDVGRGEIAGPRIGDALEVALAVLG